MKKHPLFQFSVNYNRIATILIAWVGLSTSMTGTTLTYSGNFKNYPVNVTYTFEETKRQNSIISEIKSKKFNEKNHTIIKNNQLYKMTQTTENEIDNEFFDWQVTQTKKDYKVEFKNKKFNEFFVGTLKRTPNPITLQGLIFLIQKDHLYLNKMIKTNLLTPWNSIIPIKFYVKSETTLKIQSIKIQAYIIHMELDIFLSQLLPKTTIWVSRKKPHILLKQIGLNGNYTITNAEAVLNPEHFESN